MISEEAVLEKIKENNSIEYRTLMLKLYDNYKNNQVKKFKFKNKILPIDIAIAYECIKAYVSRLDRETPINTYIKNCYDVLTVYINHFKENNKSNLNEIMELITCIELLLDVNLSFPMVADRCLEKEILKEKKKIWKW